MTILSAQSIQARCTGFGPISDQPLRISPFEEAARAYGMSYGLSSCGYDIRIGKIGKTKEDALRREGNQHLVRYTERSKDLLVNQWHMRPGEFLLCSSYEYMALPNDLCGKVHDKSTLARQGLALQNTILEPGWRGFITLELSNHSDRSISIRVGQPIAQVVFELLDEPTQLPYAGKYQDQADIPVEAVLVPDLPPTG